MKKTFYIITGIALIGCMYFESSPVYSSKAIREAELTGTPATTSQGEPETAYNITLNPDSISVIDPTTGETIYKEAGNAKSGLSEAIRKDNE